MSVTRAPAAAPSRTPCRSPALNSYPQRCLRDGSAVCRLQFGTSCARSDPRGRRDHIFGTAVQTPPDKPVALKDEAEPISPGGILNRAGAAILIGAFDREAPQRLQRGHHLILRPSKWNRAGTAAGLKKPPQPLAFNGETGSGRRCRAQDFVWLGYALRNGRWWSRYFTLFIGSGHITGDAVRGAACD